MIPNNIRRVLLDPHGVHSVEPIASGFSGAKLFRCEADVPLVLRSWPQGVATRRVQELHAILNLVSDRCSLIPARKPVANSAQTSVIGDDGSIWELMTWIFGRPLDSNASREEIGEGAGAIREVHEQFASFGRRQGTAPAVIERIERIDQLSQLLPRCFDRQLDGQVHPSVRRPLAKALSLLQARWASIACQISTPLARRRHQTLPLQYVIRDVHREHVLFCDGKVRGIIDFDAMRIDTPATDLARWASSFTEFSVDPNSTITAVLAGYFDPRSFPESPGDTVSMAGHRHRRNLDSESFPVKSDANDADFRKLLAEIAIASAWISLGNWVTWLVVESRQFPDPGRVASRLQQLIDTVEGLTDGRALR